MDAFVYLGEVQMKEYARKVERLNRRAWLAQGSDAELPSRWRFRRVRDT